MSHIFISYNHEDNDFAENLIHRLHDAGFTTWRDIDKLSAGEVWRVEIDHAIQDAFAMIVIMTPEAKISEYVTYEWAFALGVGVKVIPIILRRIELHPRLEDIQFLDFTGKFRPWDKLIDAVQRVAKLKNHDKSHTSQNIPTYIQQAIIGLNSLKAADREEAIQSLTKADHPAAHTAMIEALEHPLKEIRIRVALLLAEFQEPKVVPILIEALHSNDDNNRKNAIVALAKVGLPAVPDLCKKLYDNDKKARLAAAETLGEIGDNSPLPDLLKVLQNINEDQDTRIASAEALGKIKDNAALQSLLEILRDTKNGFSLRGTVIFALGNIKDTDAVSDLSSCLLNDEDEMIKFWAAYALGEIGSSASLSALIAALKDSDPLVRQSAVGALKKIGDTSTIPALSETLYDVDLAVVDGVLGVVCQVLCKISASG